MLGAVVCLPCIPLSLLQIQEESTDFSIYFFFFFTVCVGVLLGQSGDFQVTYMEN